MGIADAYNVYSKECLITARKIAERDEMEANIGLVPDDRGRDGQQQSQQYDQNQNLDMAKRGTTTRDGGGGGSLQSNVSGGSNAKKKSSILRIEAPMNEKEEDAFLWR